MDASEQVGRDRVVKIDNDKQLGTGFVVRLPDRGLAVATALHVVANREASPPTLWGNIKLTFVQRAGKKAVPHEVTEGIALIAWPDEVSEDWALLSFSSPKCNLQPLSCGDGVQIGSKFSSHGFGNEEGKELHGTVICDATVRRGLLMVQLDVKQMAAGEPASGYSGAPVLVGGRAEAILSLRDRKTGELLGDPALAEGGTLFAVPINWVKTRDVTAVARDRGARLRKNHQAQRGGSIDRPDPNGTARVTLSEPGLPTPPNQAEIDLSSVVVAGLEGYALLPTQDRTRMVLNNLCASVDRDGRQSIVLDTFTLDDMLEHLQDELASRGAQLPLPTELRRAAIAWATTVGRTAGRPVFLLSGLIVHVEPGTSFSSRLTTVKSAWRDYAQVIKAVKTRGAVVLLQTINPQHEEEFQASSGRRPLTMRKPPPLPMRDLGDLGSAILMELPTCCLRTVARVLGVTHEPLTCEPYLTQSGVLRWEGSELVPGHPDWEPVWRQELGLL